MITVEKLKEYGANTEEGLSRCLNNEAFYLRMVKMGLNDKHFDQLQEAVASGNAKEAFEAAHALKGVMGNLSLTPVYDPVCALTEALRGKEEIGDVSGLVQQVIDQLERGRALDA